VTVHFVQLYFDNLGCFCRTQLDSDQYDTWRYTVIQQTCSTCQTPLVLNWLRSAASGLACRVYVYDLRSYGHVCDSVILNFDLINTKSQIYMKAMPSIRTTEYQVAKIPSLLNV